jgi:hypothetical protein
MVRSEGNISLKNPVTQPGIDPETVRLVAQHLNHYATLGPIYIYIYICVCVCVWCVCMCGVEQNNTNRLLGMVEDTTLSIVRQGTYVQRHVCLTQCSVIVQKRRRNMTTDECQVQLTMLHCIEAGCFWTNYQHYSSWWSLASITTLLQPAVSSAVPLQPLTLITTLSNHLVHDGPFLLLENYICIYSQSKIVSN